MEKEYLYVGFYISKAGEYVLKIGTTNDLDRRRSEHNRNYKKSPEHTMPENGKFEYLWSLPLSKYNTLRYEDKNRELWKNMGIGNFIRNDRFILETIPEFVQITVRKTYNISLHVWGDFCLLCRN